jgi:RND family efflux transporter MFP subunit
MAQVVSKPVSRTVELPAEILPFLSVSLHARVPGYVERVLVDRGSIVKRGDLLVELSAPEIGAQLAEAAAKVQSAQAERAQAEAQLAVAQAAYDHMNKAAETPGAIAGLEVIQAAKQLDVAKTLVRSREQAIRTAESALPALRDMEAYLKITAPFDGVVTDRLIHPGALVGPGAGDVALLIVQQISHLRLVVPVPEEDVGAVAPGATVEFRVPAFPERIYSGTVARSSHSLDPKTRTMSVELDVFNRDQSLAPGMYPTVKWPVRRTRPALFVPKTSVVSNTERTFVIRNRNGRAEWVTVKKGIADGDLVEVMGELQAGDTVVRRGTDEIQDGSLIR